MCLTNRVSLSKNSSITNTSEIVVEAYLTIRVMLNKHLLKQAIANREETGCYSRRLIVTVIQESYTGLIKSII